LKSTREDELGIGKIRAGEKHYEGRMPRWLHRPILAGKNLHEVTGILRGLNLNTVCESAKCPNRMECFSSGTATFMILGDSCTRNCAFCSVAKGEPQPVDREEPLRVAEAAAAMELKHVVVTSVTRDDLADGGAAQFADTIRVLRKRIPRATVEVLTPDFKGDVSALEMVMKERPDIFNHNLETVEELYAHVRPQADYGGSLGVLRRAYSMDSEVMIKSGLMVGLGETANQLRRTFNDLKEAGCDMLTIGQYLRPSRDQIKVERFLSPGEFEALKREAEDAGIVVVASAPFVRSSYRARELLDIVTKESKVRSTTR
jgi:lipoic acid synthetase